MFKTAAKKKFRFESPKGQLTVEDLWDLPLTSVKGVSLNSVAQGIHHKLKDNEEISFVDTATASNTELSMKLDIVKAVIADRIADRDAARLTAENKEKKQKIMQIIAAKKDAAMEGMDVADLEKLLADL
jgi:hypothetical protein